MKKLSLLLLAMLAGSLALLAQQGTIQVSVSDTIEVPANHISVVISFKNPEGQYSDSPSDFSASYAEVVRLLDQYHVTWKKPSEQPGLMGMFGRMGGMGGKETNEIFADFNSVAQLEKVLPQIRLVAFTDVMETGTSVDKELLDLTRLYEKLFKKARAKAEMLARLSGKKVGGVFQIGSAFDAFSPGNSMESMMNGSGGYGELLKSMFGNMFGEKRADYKVSVTETMTVTYYLLD